MSDPRLFFLYLHQSARGLNKTDVHVISAYRRILKHARETSQSKPRRVDTSSLSMADASSILMAIPESHRSHPEPFLHGQKQFSVVSFAGSLLEDSPTSKIHSLPCLSASPPQTPTVVGGAGRAQEWDEDSGTLVADAYNIRRLLRLGLTHWCKLIRINDCILDALYVAEKEGEMKQGLSVLLAWVVFCQVQRSQRDKCTLIQRLNRKRSFKSYIRTWRRLYRGSRGIQPLLDRKSSRVQSKSLEAWKSVVRQYQRPGRLLSEKRCRAVKRTVFPLWMEARTRRYLDQVHSENKLETFKVRRAFSTLRDHAKTRLKLRRYLRDRNEHIQSELVREWMDYTLREMHKRQKILHNKSALYLLWKLMVSLPVRPQVHVRVYQRTQENLLHSVCAIALRTWRQLTMDRKTEKFDEMSRKKREIILSWMQWSLSMKRIRVSESKLTTWSSSQGVLNRLKSKFSIWNERKNRRHFLRSRLANLQERNVVGILFHSLHAWSDASSRERSFRRTAQRIGRECKREIFGIWIAKYRENISSKISIQISDLFRKKQLGKVLLGCFGIALGRRRWIEESDRRASELRMRLQFDRWKKEWILRHKTKKIEQFFANKSISICFNEWRVLHGVVLKESLNALDRADRLKEVIFKSFTLNVIAARKSRMDRVLCQEFLKRCGFFRFKRFVKNRKCIAEFRNRHVIMSLLKRWVQVMIASHSVTKLDHILQQSIQHDVFNQMRKFCDLQSRFDDAKISEINRILVRSHVREWRLVALGHRLQRMRQQRCLLTSVASDRQLKKKVLKYLVSEYAFRGKIMSLCHRQNQRLVSRVFDARNSGWRLQMTSSRVGEAVKIQRRNNWFKEWLEIAICLRSSKDRCNECYSVFNRWKTRNILLEMNFLARNRKEIKWDLFGRWRAYSGASFRLRNRFLRLAPDVMRKQVKAAMTAWIGKVLHREGLRDRVSNFASNHSRRLIVSSLIGLAENVTIGRNFSAIRDRHSSLILTRSLDRWVHATVYQMSLREVMARVERAVANLMSFSALERLRNLNRVGKFRERKSAEIDEISIQKRRILKEAVLLGWSATAYKIRSSRDKIKRMIGRRFLINLKKFSSEKKSVRTIAEIADDFAVTVEANRMADVMASIVDEWRIVSRSERSLRLRQSEVMQFQEDRLVGEYMENWKSALEYKLYEEDLRVNEELLTQRVEHRMLSNVITFMIILFKESRGLDRFAEEIRTGRLKKMGINGFRSNLDLGEKFKLLSGHWARVTGRNVFTEWFKEVYLAIKERLVWKRNASERTLAVLRWNRDRRIRCVQADIRGGWVVEQGRRRKKLTDVERIARIVLHEWKFVASQSGLTKRYLPAFEPDDSLSTTCCSALPYHHQRRGTKNNQASPLDTPATQAASINSQTSTPTIFSYRELRPRARTEMQRV